MSEDGNQSRNNVKKTGYKQPPVEHQFKPGNPGRPKGSRNKLSEDFLADMLETWGEGGIAAIRETMADRPHEYVKIVASLMPKEVNMKHMELDDLTDDQLLKRLQSLMTMAKPLLEALDDTGTASTRH